MPGESRWEYRSFENDLERDQFLKESFSILRVEELENPEEGEQPFVLRELLGESLEAVTFVMDYIQLQFAGRRLNAYVYPRLNDNGDWVSEDEESYRNRLCSLIGRKLVDADEVTDLGILLTFDIGAALSIPLNASDDGLSELAEYTAKDGTLYIWPVGDRPWE